MPRYRSLAKINLHLEVLGRRPDGFHELRTLFQTVDLADELTLEPTRTGGVELTVRGPAGIPTGPENLAWRAARVFLDRWGARGDGVRLHLDKRIPAGAGLGGGSSNAATVLRALAELHSPPVPLEELIPIARELGADVPFFLVGGAARARGRGDLLEPLPDAGRAWPVWILWPGRSLSTAAVFARWRPAAGEPPSLPPPLARLFSEGRWEGAPPDWVGWNDLETAAFSIDRHLEELYTYLAQGRARAVRMSGSGSALFAFFDDEHAALEAGRGLPADCSWVRASVVGRSAWREASGLKRLPGEE